MATDQERLTESAIRPQDPDHALVPARSESRLVYVAKSDIIFELNQFKPLFLYTFEDKFVDQKEVGVSH